MSARLFSSISCAALVVWAVTGSAQTPTPLQRGEALFFGKVPMQGKPRDHQSPFPAEVVRCANCHAAATLPLGGDLLTASRQRRGGPPSAYDETKFCKLLRTGIDPAYVMVDHAMPIYDLPDSDCAALWTYVTRKEGPNARAVR